MPQMLAPPGVPSILGQPNPSMPGQVNNGVPAIVDESANDVIMANNNGDGSSGSNSDVSIDDQHQFSNARSYQIEALDQAIKQNTIVFLETGSGKTLIAIMLLRRSGGCKASLRPKVIMMGYHHQKRLVLLRLHRIFGMKVHMCKEKGSSSNKEFWKTDQGTHTEVPRPALEMIKRDLSMLRERHESKIQNSNLSESSTESAIRRLSRLNSAFEFCLQELGFGLASKATEVDSSEANDFFTWGKQDARGETVAREFCKDANDIFSSYILHVDDMRCIIFVERVVTAIVLKSLLCELNPKLFGWKTEYTAGNNSPVQSQSRGVQNKIVDEFREGKVNIIVATSILEEGLDVQSCNLVIRFDLSSTVCSFIQSRGRARMRNSEFLLLLRSGDVETQDKVNNYLISGQIMRDASLSHAAEPCEPPYSAIFNEPVYRVESTGASLSLSSSISMVYFYCSRLPSDGYFKPYPIFVIDKEARTCYIYFPKNCPLPSVYVECNPKMLKQLASFTACIELHKLGALTDNLVPDTVEKAGNAKEIAYDFVEEQVQYVPPELLRPMADDSSKLYHKDKESSNAGVELPAEVCYILMSPISISTFYSYSLVPSIMHRIESYLIALNLKKMHLDCGQQKGNVPAFKLFKSLQDQHEGILSSRREKIISNDSLCRLGCNSNLPGFIRNEPFDPKTWSVPGDRYNSLKLEEEVLSSKRKVYYGYKRTLKKKVVADVAEALIGVFLSEGGEMAALSFMSWLGIKVDFVNTPYERNFTLQPQDYLNVQHLESLLNYKFRDASLLVEALTHGSYMLPDIPRCYQRLEFLGDAVLDYLITVHMYNKYPGMSPGMLTDLRSASVNNDCYAQSAVKVELHKHILHGSQDLHRHIATAVSDFDILSSETTFGWESETTFPKVLGDVIESLAGAILIDSGYNKEQVFASIRPLLEPLVTPETLKLHPVKELHDLVQKNHYEMRKHTKRSEDGTISFTIEVEAQGRIYKETCQTQDKKMAERLASKSVLKLIKVKLPGML
ncbi:endoribonuclease Dicer homolog 2-like protein [Tanacetum coccineum]